MVWIAGGQRTRDTYFEGQHLFFCDHACITTIQGKAEEGRAPCYDDEYNQSVGKLCNLVEENYDPIGWKKVNLFAIDVHHVYL